MDYTLSSGAQITVPNMIGSTTTITELDDGNYCVSTQGTKKGSSPTETVMSEDELVEKYPKSSLEKSPGNDCFQCNEKNETSSISDSPIVTYNPFVTYNPGIRTLEKIDDIIKAGGIKEYSQELYDKYKADPEAAAKDIMTEFYVNLYYMSLG